MIELDEKELFNVTGGTIIPYIVKKGDTLSALSIRFHCTVDQLCEWNDIKDPNMITIGQKLIIKF